MEALILSTLLIISSTVIFKIKWSRKATALTGSLSLFVVLLLNGIYLVANYFTGNGVDESVLFHLRIGLKGAGFSAYSMLITLSLGYLLFTAFISLATFSILSSRPKSCSIFWKFSASVLSITAILSHPTSKDLFKLINNARAARAVVAAGSVSAPAEYIIPDQQLPKTKNIVYIYLEGVERTYFDKELFPALMPNLKELEKNALSFTNIHQVYNTGWTIAGITASQCGIPLVADSPANSMSGMDQFLSKAVCLGDILKRDGYYLSFWGGASLDFAGKGNFFKSHGFDSVQGKRELSQKLDNPDYQSSWGVYDDSLFELVKKEYMKLSEKSEPFGLFMLNLDTHAPNGHVSQFCKNVVYQNGENSILNSIHCLDKQVSDFVEYIQNSEYKDNTLIVISSDHYGMRSKSWELLQKKKKNRRNLLMMIDPGEIKPQTVDKPGSTLDIGATILSRLGMDKASLGFGRNLLSNEMTLIEEKHEYKLNVFLIKQAGFVLSLWSYPQIKNNLTISGKYKLVNLDNRSIKFPSLFILDQSANINKIIFEEYAKNHLIERLRKMKYDQSIIWIDNCEKVKSFSSDPSALLEKNKNSFCVLLGQLGSKNLKIHKIDNASLSKITKNEIVETINSSPPDDALFQKRLSIVDVYSEYGVFQLQHLIMDDSDMTNNYTIKSAGGISNGNSFIHNMASDKNSKVVLKRGATLIGLNDDDEKPVKLLHVDTCIYQDFVPVEDNETLIKGEVNFKKIIDRTKNEFDAYAVVTHDSAVCNDHSLLTSVMSGLELKKWLDLQSTQPYIGIISKHQVVKEFLGKKHQNLSIRVLTNTKSQYQGHTL